MTARMVTYRVRAGSAEENSAYVRDVMTELADRQVVGLSYSVYLLDDGVSFVHVVDQMDDPESLSSSAAFQRFTSTLLAGRAETTPEAHTMTLVGRYVG